MDQTLSYFLKTVLRYDEASGVLIWRERPLTHFATERAWKIWNTRFPGSIAGSKAPDGYVEVGINKKRYGAHRLIWLMVYGEMPDQVDHINGDGYDNRLTNLRAVSNSINLRNQSIRRTNTSGVMGVSQRPGLLGWRAEIGVGGKRIRLGTFQSKQQAIEARREAEKKLGFHSNHGRTKTSTQALFSR